MSDTKFQLFSNNAVSLLHADLAVGGLVLTLQPGLGAQFPQPVNAGEWFLVTLETIAAPFTREIVKIVGRSGDTLIIASDGRGQEGTAPAVWVANETLVDHRVTAATMRQVAVDSNRGFGSNVVNVAVATGATTTVDSTNTAVNGLSCKWIVTAKAATKICMLEVLAVYKTVPTYVVYAKVGDRIKFNVTVDRVGTNMNLKISNTDASAMTVDSIRLQHY